MISPVVIYKSTSKQATETPGTTAHYLQGVRCYKQKSNTMTSDIMVDYIRHHLSNQFPPTDGKKLLIMDSFSGHKTAAVKEVLKEFNFDLLMIPGGTSNQRLLV